MLDDRETFYYYYMLFGYNTNRANFIDGDGRIQPISVNGVTVDARIIGAIVKDDRFITKVNPTNGKTFAEEFMDNFNSLVQADPLYNGVDRTKSLGSSLTWQDLLIPTMVETTEELKNNSNRGAIAPNWAAIGAACNIDFRTNINNYWSPYSCGSGENEGPCKACGVYCPCGYVGTENVRKNYTLGRLGYNQPAIGCSPAWTGDPEIKQWFEGVGQNITGYALYHFVGPAWDATIDSWIFNYYTQQIFSDLYTTQNTDFNDVKYIQYETPAISAEESVFYQGYYANRALRNNNQNQICGQSFYGPVPNIIYQQPDTIQLTAPSNINSWKDTNDMRSGYIKKPTGTDDRSEHEKYSWANYSSKLYGGLSCSTNLIQYPQTNLLGVNNTWLGSNISSFKKELAYKYFVNCLKQIRHTVRSAPDQYSGWIESGPSAGDDPIVGLDSIFRQNTHGYWFELVFHMILNSNSSIINVFGNWYSPYGEIQFVQNALDHWRGISGNSKIQVCSNSTGSTVLPVDRVDLSDAFEKYAISGGRLTKSGKYIWRITIPPKYFDPVTGIATLNRTNSSDTDLDEQILIDSKLDSFSTNQDDTTEKMRSRGVWIIRDVSTPPNYTPVLPT